eukprot:332104-Ditylum_brightwellii.AAC.1
MMISTGTLVKCMAIAAAVRLECMSASLNKIPSLSSLIYATLGLVSSSKPAEAMLVAFFWNKIISTVQLD